MKQYANVPESAIRAIFNLGMKLQGSYEQHKDLIGDILGEEPTGASDLFWTPEKAKKYLATLTTLQKEILFYIWKYPNRELPDIVTGLKHAGYASANSYTIAGATAGLTKKCKTHRLSPVYIAKFSQGRWGYFISDAAEKFVEQLNLADK